MYNHWSPFSKVSLSKEITEDRETKISRLHKDKLHLSLLLTTQTLQLTMTSVHIYNTLFFISCLSSTIVCKYLFGYVCFLSQVLGCKHNAYFSYFLHLDLVIHRMKGKKYLNFPF